MAVILGSARAAITPRQRVNRANANKSHAGWWEIDNRLATLGRMWRGGFSATEIADELGTTKNAVLGKAHRLRLPLRQSRETCHRWTGESPKGRVYAAEARP